MKDSQLPFLVEGILILICAMVGFLLSKNGRPYSKLKLTVHLFLFVWLSVGFGFISIGVLKDSELKSIQIPVYIMGIMIFTQLVTGILMIASNNLGKSIPKIHILSTVFMVLADIFAFFISGYL